VSFEVIKVILMVLGLPWRWR